MPRRGTLALPVEPTEFVPYPQVDVADCQAFQAGKSGTRHPSGPISRSNMAAGILTLLRNRVAGTAPLGISLAACPIHPSIVGATRILLRTDHCVAIHKKRTCLGVLFDRPSRRTTADADDVPSRSQGVCFDFIQTRSLFICESPDAPLLDSHLSIADGSFKAAIRRLCWGWTQFRSLRRTRQLGRRSVRSPRANPKT